MQTGAIEAVKQEKAVPEKGGRNYELDFFRLVFALLVFIYHTNPFIGKNTRVVLPPDLGAGAVHFFFILSGMFMANSIVKRGVTGNCAKLSIGFVLNKFKSFAPEYFAALFIGVTAKVVFSDGGIMVRLARMFPEIFCVYASGVWYNNNAATWYLSAMLICQKRSHIVCHSSIGVHSDIWLYVSDKQFPVHLSRRYVRHFDGQHNSRNVWSVFWNMRLYNICQN